MGKRMLQMLLKRKGGNRCWGGRAGVAGEGIHRCGWAKKYSTVKSHHLRLCVTCVARL